MLLEPDEDEDGDTPPGPYDTPSSSSGNAGSFNLGINGSLFGYRSVAHSLHPFHPSLPQAVALFAAFTENVAPMLHVFHMPTLTRKYWDAIAALENVDKETEALLFSIHYSAAISIDSQQSARILGCTRDIALERYRFAVEQAFARADLLNTQSITLLQAAVLFLSALRNEDESRTTWSLTALVYHAAQTMGIHRDGTLFDLKPFDTEMRRRLWWHIAILDSRSSEYHGYEPIVRDFGSDTKIPLHINDADMHPDMGEFPEERWDSVTDTTLLAIRCEAIQSIRKLGFVAPGAPKPAGGGPQTTLQEKQAVVADMKQRLHSKILRLCNPSVPIQLMFSAVARLIIARFWNLVHYPLVAASKQDSSSDGGSSQADGTPRTGSGGVSSPSQSDIALRDQLFSSSIEILELSGLILTNKDLLHWAWYSKTHINWGTVAFVLSELCSRPPSPECDRAWAAVSTVYDEWNARENKGNPSKQPLWQPVKKLLAKAKRVRETQQAQIDAQREQAQKQFAHYNQQAQAMPMGPPPPVGSITHQSMSREGPSSSPSQFNPSPSYGPSPMSGYNPSPSSGYNPSPGSGYTPSPVAYDPSPPQATPPAFGFDASGNAIQGAFAADSLDQFMEIMPDFYWPGASDESGQHGQAGQHMGRGGSSGGDPGHAGGAGGF